MKKQRFTYTWLSFVDEDEVFIGAILTECNSLEEAVEHVNRLGINPGGEVAGWTLDFDEELSLYPIDVLISKDDMIRAEGEVKTLGELEDDVKHAAQFLCSPCNEGLK